MPSIFGSLDIGVSGLNAAQVQVSTTGNNITNADSNFYTRQRVIQSATPGLDVIPGTLGTGTQIDSIVRIHDEFTFTRLKNASMNFEDTSYKKRILEELAQYFPDLKDASVNRDMMNYFKAWNDFASNPNEGSQKINLINAASVLSSGIRDKSEKLKQLQVQVDNSMRLNIEDFNSMGKQIADINRQIQRIEAGNDGGIRVNANELRDERDRLELAMAKLGNIKTYKSALKSNMVVDSAISDQGRYYTLNLGGMSIVDGTTFHPLKIENNDGTGGFSKIYYELEDGKVINMEDKIFNGKLGSSLDLRGRHYNALEQKFSDGQIQKYIDNLDTFASTFINNTNNVYAKSASSIINTDDLSYFQKDKTLMNFNKEIQHGSFDVVVYNNKGIEVARKTIEINGTTTMDDTTFGNSIIDDFNADSDDDNNNSTLDDINDYFYASYNYDGIHNKGMFSVTPKFTQGLYSISFVDNGTNFPGVIGVNRFFDGTKASNMSVNDTFIADHTRLRAYERPVEGNNQVANDMIQLQYKNLKFYSQNASFDTEETLQGFYRFLTTDIASDTQANNAINDTNKAIFNTAQSEFDSISGVDVNEELTNLIRFQASYGAAAKIITTVDKMLDTLLSLKQ